MGLVGFGTDKFVAADIEVFVNAVGIGVHSVVTGAESAEVNHAITEVVGQGGLGNFIVIETESDQRRSGSGFSIDHAAVSREVETVDNCVICVDGDFSRDDRLGESAGA